MDKPFCEGEHRWPKLPTALTRRSVGEVKLEECNNCLAVRVTQEWVTSWDATGVFYASQETIIERKEVTA